MGKYLELIIGAVVFVLTTLAFLTHSWALGVLAGVFGILGFGMMIQRVIVSGQPPG